MRRMRTLTLAALALCAFWALAQVSWAGQQPAPAGPRGERARRFAENVEERLKRMSENLNLTDEQKSKLRPVLEDEVKQVRDARRNTSLSPEERHAKIRQIRQSTGQQIDAVLTPEQRAKRDEMQQKARERRAAPGGPRENN